MQSFGNFEYQYLCDETTNPVQYPIGQRYLSICLTRFLSYSIHICLWTEHDAPLFNNTTNRPALLPLKSLRSNKYSNNKNQERNLQKITLPLKLLLGRICFVQHNYLFSFIHFLLFNIRILTRETNSVCRVQQGGCKFYVRQRRRKT